MKGANVDVRMMMGAWSLTRKHCRRLSRGQNAFLFQGKIETGFSFCDEIVSIGVWLTHLIGISSCWRPNWMGKMRLSNAERETSYKEILCGPVWPQNDQGSRGNKFSDKNNEKQLVS